MTRRRARDLITSVLLYTALCSLVSARTIDDYNKNRTNILRQESAYSLGADLKLTDQEVIVNKILMNLKTEEIEQSFYHPEKFNFSRHYFTYRDYIKTSKVYQLIRRMPKGAALHLHTTFMLDGDYWLKLTYENNLFICYTEKCPRFHFAYDTPQKPCAVKWVLVSELRNASKNVTAFDLRLKKYLTLESKDPNDMDMDLPSIWAKFDRIHPVIKSLIMFRPVQEKILYEILNRLYQDNIMYAELRNGIQRLYELDGTEHDGLYTIKLYRDVLKKFMDEHPDFVGVRYILTKNRLANISAVKDAISTAKQVKKEFPQMFAGFDLVGQEDVGKRLTDYLPVLLEAKNDLDYYFHAGETNWFGSTTDENLIDAILLGTKRIGHGFALNKHPVLMSMVKRQDIAVEVNVISNAVLALIKDVRNHPLAVFMSLGLPIVLSSDDPGVWGAEPLSHDFYVSFIAVASKHADLRLLKQLALNSIKYSCLENKRKTQLYRVFTKRWNDFLLSVIAEYRSTTVFS